ncbi:hypothetical protein [Pantoea sp. 9140]|uniref:hypothetical protein n=1 Tax=Pantoea sp. 9140 TaxID=1500896 RepID=UPI0005348CD1|nr:hypothetical protein [Pantoea sp. 9140]
MSEVKRYSHNGLRGMLEHKAGRYVSYERYAALNAERDALMAENAVRGEIIERLIGQYSAAGYHAVQNSLNPAQSLLYEAMQAMKQPATDTYLNSVRAEGVEMVKLHPAISLCSLTHICEEIAAQLRAGKDGE